MYIEKYYARIKSDIKIPDIKTDEFLSAIVHKYGTVALPLLTLDNTMKSAFASEYMRTGSFTDSFNYALETVTFSRYGRARYGSDKKYGLITFSAPKQLIDTFINCNTADFSARDYLSVATIPARLIQAECNGYDLLIYFHLATLNNKDILKVITFYVSDFKTRCFHYDIPIADNDFIKKFEAINPVLDVSGRFLRVSLLLLLSYGINFAEGHMEVRR